MFTGLGLAILALALTGGLYFGSSFAIRALARIPWRWTFINLQTFGIVVTEDDRTPAGDRGGGNVVDLLHAVPGKVLVKTDPDPMEWYFERGADPEHDNFLFRKLGVQDMGSIFYTLRTNVDKHARYARPTDVPTGELQTVTKVNESRMTFYSFELTVTIKDSDTKDRIPIQFEIDFVCERIYPLKSVVRVADAPALLTSFVSNIVNNETSTQEVTLYYGGDETKKAREKLCHTIASDSEFQEKVRKELGLDITSVSIRSVDVDAKYKAMLAKKVEAEKEAEAKTIEVVAAARNTVTKAKAAAEAKMLDNEAEANRVNTVLLPLAQNERTVALRFAEAYEKNTNVTTFAPGAHTIFPLPSDAKTKKDTPVIP